MGRKKLARRRKKKAAARERLAKVQRELRAALAAGRDGSVLRKRELAAVKALRTWTQRVENSERAVARRTLNETVAFDGVPVFRGQALAFADARAHGAVFLLTSGDRRKGVAERFGKKSQLALWLGWTRRLPGFNPANPPNASSHELRHDGSAELSRLSRAYRKVRGALLNWWCLGVDASGADSLRSTLSRLGYGVRRTYSDSREQHHSNFTVSPYGRLRKRKII